MVHAGGRPLPSLINDNFERLERVENSSNRYYWKCKHCSDADNSSGARIQGRDNNLPNHLIKRCTNANAPLRQAACLFIMEKTGYNADPNAILTALDASQSASGTSTVPAISIKKRKASNLDGYIDRPLSSEQNNLANAKLLRCVILSSLSSEPRDADDLLAGPGSISPDDIVAEFAALEELKKTEAHSIDKVEVLEGNAFDFGELDRVEQGIVPQPTLDEVDVVNYHGEVDGWDEATLMSSLGMSCT
ncbi:hypothetical protein EDD22DRAFT_1031796 [Suillus occidentalis]|nr:hypothetical protein EDD22DRAFT_1031796 [Suillus occidentalis]